MTCMFTVSFAVYYRVGTSGEIKATLQLISSRYSPPTLPYMTRNTLRTHIQHKTLQTYLTELAQSKLKSA